MNVIGFVFHVSAVVVAAVPLIAPDSRGHQSHRGRKGVRNRFCMFSPKRFLTPFPSDTFSFPFSFLVAAGFDRSDIRISWLGRKRLQFVFG